MKYIEHLFLHSFLGHCYATKVYVVEDLILSLMLAKMKYYDGELVRLIFLLINLYQFINIKDFFCYQLRCFV